MSYSITTTRSETFTLTDAKHIASKIATDLEYLNTIYGWFSRDKIDDFVLEAVLLMKEGVLGTVEYGFKKDGNSILTLKYSMNWYGTLVNHNPGGVPRGISVNGANEYSYLSYGDKWWQLSSTDRDKISFESPIKRSNGHPPAFTNGYWENDRSYSSNGGGVQRGVFRAFA